jgi:hypothetical protein
MGNPSDIKVHIARQFFVALQRRGADKLLSIIESYGDTLSNGNYSPLCGVVTRV